jgi:ketosteroid isomerase-like protein
MDAGRPRFDADRREQEELAARFFDALREGDVDGLRELLAADVQLVSDSGASTAVGRERSVRELGPVLAAFPAVAVRDRRDDRAARAERPAGAIFRDREGRVLNTWTVDILADGSRRSAPCSNTEKLGTSARSRMRGPCCRKRPPRGVVHAETACPQRRRQVLWASRPLAARYAANRELVAEPDELGTTGPHRREVVVVIDPHPPVLRGGADLAYALQQQWPPAVGRLHRVCGPPWCGAP